MVGSTWAWLLKILLDMGEAMLIDACVCRY